jgi:hypothetical protein
MIAGPDIAGLAACAFWPAGFSEGNRAKQMSSMPANAV